MKHKKIISFVICVSVSVLYIVFFSEIKDDVINAICLCGKNIIPSLFPITVLSVFIADYFSDLLRSVKSKLLFAFFLSLVGGFPMGAIIISSMYQNNEIDKKTAGKSIAVMFCPGPAFTVLFTGEQIFHSKNIGYLLYLIAIITETIPFAFLISKIKTTVISKNKTSALYSSFTNSIKKSASSVFTVCAYIIFFSALNGIINNIFTNLPPFLKGLLEVTSGVIETKNIYFALAELLFGGFCIHAQIASVCTDLLNYRLFIFERIRSLILGEIFLFLTLKIFRIKISTVLNEPASFLFTSSDIISSVFLLMSLLVLIISLNQKICGKTKMKML